MQQIDNTGMSVRAFTQCLSVKKICGYPNSGTHDIKRVALLSNETQTKNYQIPLQTIGTADPGLQQTTQSTSANSCGHQLPETCRLQMLNQRN